MDSLKDWYRYLDEVSRPARRGDEETASESSWRPWMPAEEAEPLPEAEPLEFVPELPLTASPGTFLDPTPPVFRDLTVDDELQPMPRFTVPELHAPAFEVSIPSLGGEPRPAAAPGEPAASPPAPSRESSVGAPPRNGHHRGNGSAAVAAPAPPPVTLPEAAPEAADASEGYGEERAAPGTMAPRYRELLSQIRSHDVAQNSYKSPFRETREELVQRLLDPPLTLEETARLLGVCPTTIRRYTNKGMLRHFRTSGNQRRFRLSDVLEFLETRFTEIEADQKVDQQTEEFKQNQARQEA